MKTSIVVPVFGETPHLGELRSSIAAQTFRDFEVIECAPPAGNENAGAARNAGLEQAKGEWIYFADADDRLKPELLERAMAAEGVTAAHSAGLAIRASQAERKRVPSVPSPTAVRWNLATTTIKNHEENESGAWL